MCIHLTYSAELYQFYNSFALQPIDQTNKQTINLVLHTMLSLLLIVLWVSSFQVDARSRHSQWVGDGCNWRCEKLGAKSCGWMIKSCCLQHNCNGFIGESCKPNAVIPLDCDGQNLQYETYAMSQINQELYGTKNPKQKTDIKGKITQIQDILKNLNSTNNTVIETGVEKIMNVTTSPNNVTKKGILTKQIINLIQQDYEKITNTTDHKNLKLLKNDIRDKVKGLMYQLFNLEQQKINANLHNRINLTAPVNQKTELNNVTSSAKTLNNTILNIILNQSMTHKDIKDAVQNIITEQVNNPIKFIEVVGNLSSNVNSNISSLNTSNLTSTTISDQKVIRLNNLTLNITQSYNKTSLQNANILDPLIDTRATYSNDTSPKNNNTQSNNQITLKNNIQNITFVTKNDLVSNQTIIPDASNIFNETSPVRVVAPLVRPPIYIQNNSSNIPSEYNVTNPQNGSDLSNSSLRSNLSHPRHADNLTRPQKVKQKQIRYSDVGKLRIMVNKINIAKISDETPDEVITGSSQIDTNQLLEGTETNKEIEQSVQMIDFVSKNITSLSQQLKSLQTTVEGLKKKIKRLQSKRHLLMN